MRIVFLAMDDEFAGEMQKYLFERHPDWIVGSVISKCTIYKKSELEAALFIIRTSGIFYLYQMCRIKIIRKLFGSKNKEKPSSLAKKYKIDTFYTKNINDNDSLKRIRVWRPDIVISTNFSHFVGKRAREIALIGTWNLHKSYLPKYRGMAPSFHALLNGEKSVGATLHVIDKGFDTGPIIKQVEVSVQEGDTVYNLNKRTSEMGGKMLAELLDNVDSKSINPSTQPFGNWKTYSYPTKGEIHEFRKKKNKFDKIL